jgi:penicillin-binding protein 2
VKKPRNPFSEQTTDLSLPHFYVTVGVACLFLLLLLRLWFLQIIKGEEYRTMSESNRTRIQDIIPPRGMIEDRNNTILVDNYPSYELTVVLEDVPDDRELVGRLAFLLDMSLTEIREKVDAAKKLPPFKPALIRSGLTREELVAVETHRFELPGVAIQVKPRRRYLHELLASQVIGYLGEVTQAQLDHADYTGHRMGDLAGQYGLELSMEGYLHGRRGQRLVEVDASGRVLKVIRKVDPVPGHNCVLTLDERLQQVAQDALGDQVGAVVAMDPNNGEILALASMPTFNQSDFVQGITPEKWKELLDNPLKPLENRAVSGQYPPGSTYKIVAATAALSEGVVTPETIINCPGGLFFGNRMFGCWKKTGHGAVNLHRALKESCDTYFYEVGRRMGIDVLAKYGQAFGLGSPTGLGLANEKPGLVASSAWKKKRFGVSWQPGETLSVAIGQGYNTTTPLQMAQVVSVVANGGILYQPHLVKRVVGAGGEVVKEFEPEVVRRLEVKPEHLAAIKKALAAVVNEPGGTGGRARMEDVIVGGKTGTSQVVSMKKFEGYSAKNLPWKYRDHAWFVAFAPVDAPRIAVAVILEHAGHGGSASAPVAKKVLQAFFHPEEYVTVDLPEDDVAGEEPGD